MKANVRCAKEKMRNPASRRGFSDFFSPSAVLLVLLATLLLLSAALLAAALLLTTLLLTTLLLTTLLLARLLVRILIHFTFLFNIGLKRHLLSSSILV
ncbi:MAG: hypothetical protein WCD56_06500 [Pseudolabrys sp.]